jgi:hypothetical protein
MESKTAAIITRYNETIDWLDYIKDQVDIFYIYNKGPNDNLFKTPITDDLKNKIKIIKIENVGRIDHTLAYHILNNWDSLEENLLSLPASILMCYRKGSYLGAIKKNLIHYKVKYRGFYSPRFHRVSHNFNYNIDDYQAEGACNRNDNKFVKSEYPDFQAWKSALIDTRPMRYVSMRGMFIVHRDNVKYISKKIYENLLKSLSVGDNIENGHFAERIWAHLFRQHSFDTIYIESLLTDCVSTLF